LDLRDWPSYLYVVIAFLILFYLPLQVYQLYRRAQMQATVIESIASGDPEIRQILDLVAADPTADWTNDTIREKSEATEIDYSGVEVLTHSRIIDLRRWRPNEVSSSRQGNVFIRDRVTLKLLDSYSDDRRVTFSFPSPIENVEFRQPNPELQGIISRVATPIKVHGEKQTLYEIEYNLARIPWGEPVTLELELLVNVPKVARAAFVTRRKTDLVSVWMLFPADRPYRTYDLVCYPNDRSAPPEVMNSRYLIDHPYGSLIGWSVVNPKVGNVYECRWTTE
jgi:hypothetical protein